jgi:hypothetical protein
MCLQLESVSPPEATFNLVLRVTNREKRGEAGLIFMSVRLYGRVSVGGRLKCAVGDTVVLNERARRDLRGRIGIVIQVGPVKGEYGVELSDGHRPSLVYIEAINFDVVRGDDGELTSRSTA